MPWPFLIFPTQPSLDPNVEEKAGPVALDSSSSWYSRTRRSSGEGAEDGRRLRRRRGERQRERGGTRSEEKGRGRGFYTTYKRANMNFSMSTNDLCTQNTSHPWIFLN